MGDLPYRLSDLALSDVHKWHNERWPFRNWPVLAVWRLIVDAGARYSEPVVLMISKRNKRGYLIMGRVFVALTLLILSSFPSVDIGDAPHNFIGDRDCLECHSSLLAGSSKHFFNSGDECDFCHESVVTSEGDTLMTISQDEPCLICHVESEHFSMGGSHGDESCLGCHTPHSSDYASLINRPIIELCSETCHGSEKIGVSHPVGEGIIDHNTGDEMTCTSTCHQLHSPGSSSLLYASSTDLCFDCHGEKF